MSDNGREKPKTPEELVEAGQAELRAVLGETGLLRARLGEHKVEFGERCSVTLRALPACVEAYCRDVARGVAGAVWQASRNLERLRFSIVAWEGMIDDEGAEVAPEFDQVWIHDRYYQALKQDQLNSFRDATAGVLAREVERLNALGPREKKDLSSTGTSPAKTSPATSKRRRTRKTRAGAALPAAES